MREEEQRLLPRGSFLPVFERCRMMPALDRWVMRRAIARLARGPRVPSLSLNISGQTLSDADFPPAVATELSRHRVPPASIAFEVLEEEDRKSTRLNSSHDQISYAVFCLKKKK